VLIVLVDLSKGLPGSVQCKDVHNQVHLASPQPIHVFWELDVREKALFSAYISPVSLRR
jgi:hypothetical protein